MGNLQGEPSLADAARAGNRQEATRRIAQARKNMRPLFLTPNEWLHNGRQFMSWTHHERKIVRSHTGSFREMVPHELFEVGVVTGMGLFDVWMHAV
jgi:hypothetical protein